MAQAIPMALMVGGQLVKGVGGYVAGQQNQRQMNRQARNELAQGLAEETRIRESARAAMGEQVAAQFSNGFQGGSGSALDALTQSQINATLDALTVRREASSKAAASRAAGRQASTQGKFALVEALVGAGSAAASMNGDWASARQGRTETGKGG
jgi:hypothetical protein